MSNSDRGADPNEALARQAGPLRQSLARFFRRRVPDQAEVDDLVQEVFTRVVARDSSNPVEHLGGYVFQTAASVLADRARRRFARHAEDHVEFDPDQHAERDLDAERLLSGREDLRAATAALLSLPERTRTIFVLHRLEGLGYREIGGRLGISVSAVEKHMARAVRHLAQHLKDRL
ncbi:MAG TPA: sigma-70 family RNA polymerase sigma factor [Allosphingosinicella sp.]|jgi:RNA polymerase sigma-70 factor (ECF subfamily)